LTGSKTERFSVQVKTSTSPMKAQTEGFDLSRSFVGVSQSETSMFSE